MSVIAMMLKHRLLSEAESEGAEGASPAPEVEGTGGETAGGDDAASGSDVWADLLDDAPEPQAETPQEPEPEQQAEVEQEPTQEPQAQEQESQPQEETQTQEESQQQTQEETKQQKEEPQFSDEDFQKQLQEHYKLSDEDVKALQQDPERALPELLPKMAATLHMNVMKQYAQAMEQSLPQYVQGVQQQMQAQEKAANDFYSKWPELKGKDEAEVARIVQTYRQVNPQKSVEEVIEGAGRMAMLQFGLPLEGTGQAKQTPPKQTPPPPPAQPGGSPSAGQGEAQSSQNSGNPFADLAEEIMREDI